MSKNNIDEIIKAVERYKSGRTSQNAEAKRLGDYASRLQEQECAVLVWMSVS